MYSTKLNTVLWPYVLSILPVSFLPACAHAPDRTTERQVQAAVASPPSHPEAHHFAKMASSWAAWYNSLSDLKAHSDFAVRGHVASIAPAVKPSKGPVYQMVTLSTESVPWQNNGSGTNPTAVTFEQTGGTVGNTTYEDDDDPLFRVGEEVIVFFQEYSPGMYRVSGGPTGRFAVTTNGVQPITPGGISVPAGTSVGAFFNL